MNHEIDNLRDDEEISPLLGKKVAFTGILTALSRREAFSLVRRAGGTPMGNVSRRTDLLVVGTKGWPILRDGSVSRKLEQAETLQEKGLMLEIVSEKRFMERLGVLSSSSAPGACTIEKACRLVGLSSETIRRCEQFGLIRTRENRLAFQDLVSLRRIASLLQEGMTPVQISRALARLARHLPEFEYPLAQIRLILDRSGAPLAELQGARIDASGQLQLDFSGELSSPAASIHLQHPSGRADADRWFHRGMAAETEGETEEAADAYHRALRSFPAFAEALYNLGNLELQQEKFSEAEHHFREAVSHHPDLVPAWYNLGHVLAETGRMEEAIEALRRASALSPEWADPHFNLAVCFEELERHREAAVQWRAYLALESDGDWAEMARAHLRRSAIRAIAARGGTRS